MQANSFRQLKQTKGSLSRPMSEEDVKNQKPPHFQRKFTQLVHCKLLAQCDAHQVQKGLILQNKVIELQQ